MHWLLAHTKPRLESVAEEHLCRQGYDVLCPLIRVQRLRRGKWASIEEPLFPRYVFVGVQDEQSWAPVRSAVGVSSFVKFGGVYAEVPEALVQSLKQSTGGALSQRPLFVQGTRLKIVAGPFASLDAIFDMPQGSERATVLLDLLGRQSRVIVSVAQLVAQE
jgi:transcriptional antiterminator RfaH